MKSLLIGILVASIIGSALYLFHQDSANFAQNQMENSWFQWKLNFQKSYQNLDEEAFRRRIFEQNFKKIEAHNSDSSQTYTMGLNQFSDITDSEFQNTYLRSMIDESAKMDTSLSSNLDYPSEVDWRTVFDVVSPVRNQGSSGDCATFSCEDSLESLSAIALGRRILLSIQQLIDCAGSTMQEKYEYAVQKGVTTSADYPYVGPKQPCKKEGGSFKIKSYTAFPQGNVDQVTNGLSTKPVAVAVDASNWSAYSGGVFSNCGTNLNHAAMMVGYVVNNYWIVKNSWGTSWGERGYIRLKYGNTCWNCNKAFAPNY